MVVDPDGVTTSLQIPGEYEPILGVLPGTDELVGSRHDDDIAVLAVRNGARPGGDAD